MIYLLSAAAVVAIVAAVLYIIASPSSCKIGYYVDVDDKCKKCPDGKFSSTTNSTKCKDHTVTSCPSGQYLVSGTNTTDSKCSDCPDGQYKIGNNSSGCLPKTTECPTGKRLITNTLKTIDNECILISESRSESESKVCENQTSGIILDENCVKVGCKDQYYGDLCENRCTLPNTLNASKTKCCYQNLNAELDEECNIIKCKDNYYGNDCEFSCNENEKLNNSKTQCCSYNSSSRIQEFGEDCAILKCNYGYFDYDGTPCSLSCTAFKGPGISACYANNSHYWE